MHRSVFPLLVLCITTLLMAAGVYAQDKPTAEVARKMISIPLKQPSTDDYLIEMARAADVNVIADATHFPATAPPLSGEWRFPSSNAIAGQWQGAVGNLFLELANERKLTYLDYDARTFLFWSEPDIIALARGLIAASPAEKISAETEAKSSAEARDLDDLLNDYFWRVRGWDGVSPQAAFDIKPADLPPALRSALMAYGLKQVQIPSMAQESIWFGDDIWKEARLQIRKVFAGDTFRQLIIGGVRYKTGDRISPTFRGVALVDDPRTAK